MTNDPMQLTVVAPGRSPAAIARATLVRLGRKLWRALEAHGRNKATQTLLELADRREATAPEVARQLRAACRWMQACKPEGPQARRS
jgi:hypothetical protein